MKRISIKRRILFGVLCITLAILVASIIVSIAFLRGSVRDSERMLSEELSRSLRNSVEQKASKSEVMLDAYEGYIIIIRDYIESMYRNYDELAATGHYVDSPRETTGKDEYAYQSGFADEDANLDDYVEEISFFSHLETAMDSVARKNEEQITTIYLGTVNGLLMSYDKWSWLSAVPEPELFVYDFTQSEWYNKGLEEDGVFYTGLYVDSQGRGLTITIGTPFQDADGNIAGVLAADFDITGIYNDMISMDFGSGSASFAIEKDGDIIGIDSDEEVPAGNYLGLEDASVREITSGRSGILETGDAFYAYAPVKNVGWTLCAVVPQTVVLEQVEVMEASFRTAMLIFLIIGALLVAACVLVTRRFTKSITYPIELLARDMKRIENGDLDHQAAAVRNDEIGDVTIGLNAMVSRLKDTMNDLVNAERVAAEMSERASKDALTGVLNKGAFSAYIQDLQEKVSRGSEKEYAIAVFDCDDLKGINDKYGHDRGDEYLTGASCLICCVYQNSPVFRIGGDEFAAVLTGEDFGNREALASRFEKECRESKGEQPWERVRVTLGCAAYDPLIDRDVSDTVRRADLMMYGKKQNGKKREDQEEKYWAEMYIVDNYKSALENHWFKVYYQPIMRIQNGKMTVLEALARWVDPVRGMITPGEFIPVLSRLHRLHQLDLYMVEEVCREFKVREEEGLPLLPVSVNISAQDFDHVNVPLKLKEITEKYGLEPKNIIVEITEQDIAKGTDRFNEDLKKIREYGFRLWIDDFGSGYSSLNVLSQYDADCIKFDMELLRSLDGTNKKILDAMVKICREIGVQTLAEGVETEEQLSFLKKIGCDMAQGYYFFKPDPADVSIYKFRKRKIDIPYETDSEREKACDTTVDA